ncbi:MAG TPA: N-acetylmuramoyl-L-alanine amidase [Longimicrobium sp.]|nr:N-acetylmuramoyl-L-alanine amidase [Longimicrobium sp.]
MRAIPALLVLAVSLFSTSLSAQAARWRLENGPAPALVAEATIRGYAALPASSLVGLGAQVAYEGDAVVARFGAREVRFRVGEAAVAVDGAPRPLSNPVYEEGGVVFLPADFFRRVLADVGGGALEVDAAARVVRRVGALPAAAAPVEEAPPVRAVSAEPPRRRLVVVDAGHGGRDPGARGPGGTREKDITLALARRVAALLRDDPTLEVRMTRDRDTLIALHDRARFANRWKDEGQPALFLSIHCNANESRSEKGFETYFLSEARTADARRVEQFENSAVQYEERSSGDPLGFILTDLRQNQYLRESSDWAQMIQDALDDVHDGPNRGVKQAGFAVLRGTFMPAVLVEVGFISNRTEEQMLRDPEEQGRIARKLAEAVKNYFDRPAPRRAAE